MLKKTSVVLGIIIIAGLSGIIADRYLFPRLATTKLFSKYEFLKKSTENVTVINKTEQVYVKEDSSVGKIVSQVTPAVVNIVSHESGAVGASFVSFKNGTGTIVTSDGIIMTHAEAIELPANLSALEEGINYKVMTADGNSYGAKLLGVDSWSNLAFLKIEASNLPVVSFGNFEDYSAGEKVIAIGNDTPQYQNRFSSGIINVFDPTFNVSGQALGVAEKMEGVFLTDFSTENMSVGSPIVDYSGRVVGLTGSVLKNNQNEYFEIPSDKIEKVIDRVINKNLENSPFLGVYYVPINKSYALANNLETTKGALVYSAQGLAVIFGSPAGKAGLLLGDVIVKLNDEEITLENNLSTILYKYKKGDKIEFTVLRQGQELKLPVEL